jgi:serine/threonine-protein kinase
MAPEAILAPDTVGPPADVYAVGSLAHFLLTGRPPFPGTTFFEVCGAHIHAPPPLPSTHSPAPLPPALDALVVRCLDKDPHRRPHTRELGLLIASLSAA